MEQTPPLMSWRQRAMARFGGRWPILLVGTVHPRHEDIVYPVNYGYVPDTLSGGGAPIDAYLLGVHEPVAEAVGIVIALVIRRNDIEDKLVVAPVGMDFPADEIRFAVDFQERYFDSHVVVVYEGGS